MKTPQLSTGHTVQPPPTLAPPRPPIRGWYSRADADADDDRYYDDRHQDTAEGACDGDPHWYPCFNENTNLKKVQIVGTKQAKKKSSGASHSMTPAILEHMFQ